MELWDIVDESGNRTGRLHEKGKPMQAGEYHLSVMVWILNNKGQFLISKRTPNEPAPNMWETTGGGALAGESSLNAALRETREELGISLLPENGRVFLRYTYPHSDGSGAAYIEVWVFHQSLDIETVVLQPNETCDAKWADKEQIHHLMREGKFIRYTYIDQLFDQYLK